MKIIKSVFLSCFLSFVSLATQADVVVVVNSNSSAEAISRSDLVRIFMGKVDQLAGGKVVPVNQIAASDSRKSFDTDLLGKTTQQMNAYWSKQMFAGNGTPPQEFSGDLDVLKHVAESTDAIGYIDDSAVNGSVKVVKVLD